MDTKTKVIPDPHCERHAYLMGDGHCTCKRPVDHTTPVLMAVAAERGRQEQLCAAGKFPFTCAHLAYPSSGTPIDDGRKLAILVEEVGEVAKEINEGPDHPELQRIFHPAEWRAQRLRLRTELIQVAAVATAIVESIDAQMEGRADLPVRPDPKPSAGLQESASVPEPSPYAGGVL